MGSRLSLRARIGLASAFALAATIVAASTAIYVAQRHDLRSQVARSLRQNASVVKRSINIEQSSKGTRNDFPAPPGRFSEPPDGPPGWSSDAPGAPPNLPGISERNQRTAFGGAAGYIQFIDKNGTASLPPDEKVKLPVTSHDRKIARDHAGSSLRDAYAGYNHLYIYTVPVRGGALQIARPLDEVDASVRNTLTVLAVVGAAGIALAALLGMMIARTALSPIRKFTEHTEAITASRSTTERIAQAGPHELERLARSYNSTLDALAVSIESQRQLVADASHELRTPLASIRTNIQVLEEYEKLPVVEQQRMREDILLELDELTSIVADIVDLARGEDNLVSYAAVQLEKVVQAEVERATRRAAGSVEYLTDLEPTIVQGNAERIARAVANLLDNARKYGGKDSSVAVSLHDGIVTVRDHGSGFAEADLPHVFERFYRSADSRSEPGSGLGLAIVQQTAENHGGYAHAANADGGGAEITVSFGEVDAAD